MTRCGTEQASSRAWLDLAWAHCPGITKKEEMARATGLEPAASGVTGRRSNQLSYARNSFSRPPFAAARVTERWMYVFASAKSSERFTVCAVTFSQCSEAKPLWQNGGIA